MGGENQNPNLEFGRFLQARDNVFWAPENCCYCFGNFENFDFWFFFYFSNWFRCPIGWLKCLRFQFFLG